MLALTLLCTLFAIYLIKNTSNIITWYHRRCRRIELGSKIPGPRGLPLIGNVLEIIGGTQSLMIFLQREYNNGLKNGNDFRSFWVGDKLFVLAITSNVGQNILESQVEFSKGDTYDFLADWLGYGLLISSDDVWRRKRKILTPTFSYNMLKKYFGVYNEESKILLTKLQPYAESGEEVNVFEYAKRAVLDIICVTAMGVKINAQDNHDHEYIKAIKNFHKLNLEFIMMPLYKIKPIYYIFGSGFERDSTLKVLHSLAHQVIKRKTKEFEKKKSNINDNTFLSMLLELKGENNWTDKDIFEEVNTFLFTDIQQKVYEEIYDVFGDEEEDITAEDLTKLPYLDMFLRETLRRHAILPYFVRTLLHEVEVCGKLLPVGTNIMFAPQHSNFNPKIFPDPYKFDPNRFLQENIAKVSQYDFIPFSAGPRNCIGQRFGMNQVKVMIIWTLKKYKLLTSKTSDFVKHIPEIVQRPSNGIPLMFKYRK
uniref:Cytochrome P450 n=1 Tax=Parastrongyloides trichosuri TaxID=131310 RepID=A0A0N4ZZY0_PARTI